MCNAIGGELEFVRFSPMTARHETSARTQKFAFVGGKLFNTMNINIYKYINKNENGASAPPPDGSRLTTIEYRQENKNKNEN